MPKSVKIVILALLGILLVSASFWAGFGIYRMFVPPSEAELKEEAYTLLQQYYVNPAAITPGLLKKASVDEMLASLNDSYTRHISAAYWQQLQSYLGGDYLIGIGVKLGEEVGIRVLGIVPGSPADEAGVQPDDLILAIDGNSTLNMTAEEAAQRIQGAEGTNVTLQLEHPNLETESKAITRQKIDVSTWWQGLVDGNIAYIDIDYFSGVTDEELRAALEHIHGNVDGVILDLRDDPGGLVDAAVNVTDQFLEGNVTIATIVYGDGSEETFTAQPGGLAEDPDLKVAVLVNENTASAAEMVAAALQDSDGPGCSRVCLIGNNTYGKGCMQVICDLSDGSAVSITCAHWYSPSRYADRIYLTGGNGLIPDILVAENPLLPGDEQLEAAINYIGEPSAGQKLGATSVFLLEQCPAEPTASIT